MVKQKQHHAASNKRQGSDGDSDFDPGASKPDHSEPSSSSSSSSPELQPRRSSRRRSAAQSIGDDDVADAWVEDDKRIWEHFQNLSDLDSDPLSSSDEEFADAPLISKPAKPEKVSVIEADLDRRLGSYGNVLRDPKGKCPFEFVRGMGPRICPPRGFAADDEDLASDVDWGPRNVPDHVTTPHEFWSLIWPPDVLRYICCCTNSAIERGLKSGKLHLESRAWTPLIWQEIAGYFGVLYRLTQYRMAIRMHFTIRVRFALVYIAAAFIIRNLLKSDPL